jgi:hypothetical protein
MSETNNAGKQSTQDFWSKMLSAAKVKRILEKRGFAPAAFRSDYEADTSRGPRVPRRPTKQELDSVESFQKTGDFEAFRSALGGVSANAANAALRRVMQFKALGGVKTVRRRGGSVE